MLKLNSTKEKIINCVTCSKDIKIKVYANPEHPDYEQPIVANKKTMACSRECHHQWQKTLTWEDRFGEDKAKYLKESLSYRSTHNNVSTRPDVAKKISNGVTKFCKDNPEIRKGENNGFFGKTHTDEQKQQWVKNKSGKLPYNEEQRAKQLSNTPKKENHPNWNGGSSTGPYGPEFTRKLKQEIKEDYDHKCQICGIAGVELDVHHIDYDKLNNHKSNLLPLCKVCHGKTNYDRSKWQTICEGKVDLKVKL